MPHGLFKAQTTINQPYVLSIICLILQKLHKIMHVWACVRYNTYTATPIGIFLKNSTLYSIERRPWRKRIKNHQIRKLRQPTLNLKASKSTVHTEIIKQLPFIGLLDICVGHTNRPQCCLLSCLSWWTVGLKKKLYSSSNWLIFAEVRLNFTRAACGN